MNAFYDQSAAVHRKSYDEKSADLYDVKDVDNTYPSLILDVIDL